MMKEINIDDYDYELPDERIAQFPVEERDSSKLLVLKGSELSTDAFSNLGNHIPSESLLVFNNSEVIRARLLFGKETGAVIEVFCLEPLSPSSYEGSFASKYQVEWKCIVGNLKKWKSGVIRLAFSILDEDHILEAEKINREEGESWRIRLKWNSSHSFGEVLEEAGHVPLPPYIERADEKSDALTYQTVYSSIKGSVAAPTAGLHFTDRVLEDMMEKGIKTAHITLHVGAGTFQPVKVKNALEHEMHNEHFIIKRETIELLIQNKGKIIAVGTTSVRTLESIYWLGVKFFMNSLDNHEEFMVSQWEPYEKNTDVSEDEALNAVLMMIKKNNLLSLYASTSIMIIPGYQFRIVNGIITNFHQPRSTLLLLVSAWIGERWKKVYRYALNNNFRFLSYGDSSLLLPQDHFLLKKLL